MKPNIVFLLTSLILCEWLGLASIGLAAGGEWTKKTNMPIPRQGLVTAVVNGNIYAIGGIGGWGLDPLVATVEAYDPRTDTWGSGCGKNG